MEKKKVVFINNHFQYSDGTVRALIGLVNNLDLDKFDITIIPMYRCDRRLEEELKEGIKLKKAFGFYFKGFSRIARLIPKKILYKWLIDSKYDIEVAFQCDIPTLLVGSSLNEQAVHVAWMHCYESYECYKKLDKVVCVSKYCADKTIDDMGSVVDVTYIYNLVDDKTIREASNEQVDLPTDRRPLFISVGRLSVQKGYVRLVKIMSELRDEGFDFHLLIVGDGENLTAIEKEIENRNMQNFVTLVGADNNPHKYTAKADLFICSSLFEGYSTACTEAAIIGVPIITTNVPGGEEIIDDCKCGLLTSLEDNDLKQAIKQVLEKPELLGEWKQIMQRTSHKFDLNNRKKEMIALFDDFYHMSEQKQNK